MPTSDTSAALLPEVFPPEHRKACGISIVSLTYEEAIQRLLTEAEQLGAKPNPSVTAAALVTRIDMAYLPSGESPTRYQFRFELLEKMLGVTDELKARYLEVRDYVIGLERKYNPGRADERSGEVEVWVVDSADQDQRLGKLREFRLLVELLRLRDCSCPLTGKRLVPGVGAEGNGNDVVEIDHCIPMSYEHSPMRLVSRAANRIFGHIPWAVKSSFLSGQALVAPRSAVVNYLELVTARPVSRVTIPK